MIIICPRLKFCSNTPLILISFLLMVAVNFNAILQLLAKELGFSSGYLCIVHFCRGRRCFVSFDVVGSIGG